MPSSFAADARAVYDFVETFFDALCAAGVEHVVISPGSRSTPLAIGASRTAGLRSWISLDERAASFFALGVAQATRRPAALVCTSGTAAANYLPAIVEAHYSRVPLLALTADRPAELRDWGAGQTIEQPGLYGCYPRWSSEVPVPSAGEASLRYAGRLAARAVEMAIATPAGAVHLNWPLREPLEPVAERPPAPPRRVASGNAAVRFSQARLEATSGDVEELVSLVRQHERGVICCGPMDADRALVTAISRFARAAGWPVLADPASQLRTREEGPEGPILDMGDALARAPGFSERMRPEVVLRVGQTPVSKAQRLWIEAARPEAVWWFDEGGQWGEPSQLATRVVRYGAASLLEAASASLRGHVGAGSGWCRALESANAAARRLFEDLVSRQDAWSGLTVAAAVARRMPDDSVLFASNSMSIRLLDLALANRRAALRVLCNRGASGIDGISSTALGVAAAQERPTVLLTGDLAFLHDLSGLLVARRERIPLTIVVIDDNGGGIFSFLPVAGQREAVDFERLFHTPHEIDLARACALFELDYQNPDSLDSLEAALDLALLQPGVSVVHARVGAKQNEMHFREGVAKLCEVVDAVMEASDAAGGAAASGGSA